MKSKRIALLFLALFASVGKAASPPGLLVPLFIGEVAYCAWFEDYGVLAQSLERGFPREPRCDLTNLAPEDARPPLKKVVTLAEALEINLEETMRRREARLGGKGELVAVVASEPAAASLAPKPVSAFSDASWKNFCGCVHKTIPALRMKLRLASMDSSLASYEIESELLAHRGDGKFVTAGGIACGRHLGQHGFSSPGASSEIQWLAAFERTTDEKEVQRLWRHFQILGSSLRGETTRAPAFWEYAWKKLAFRKVMTKASLPDLQILVDEFIEWSRVDTKVGKGTLSMAAPRAEVEAAVLEDWNDKRFAHGVSACASLK